MERVPLLREVRLEVTRRVRRVTVTLLLLPRCRWEGLRTHPGVRLRGVKPAYHIQVVVADWL